jgi:hypothetical protein
VEFRIPLTDLPARTGARLILSDERGRFVEGSIAP